MVVGREGIGFMMVQAIAIGGDARHEDIAAEAVAGGAHGGFDMVRGGAALPVVDIVENDFEAMGRNRLGDGLHIVAVTDDVGHLLAVLVGALPVHDGDIMPGFHQGLHQRLTDELSSTDDENFHRSSIRSLSYLRLPVVLRRCRLYLSYWMRKRITWPS